MSAVRDLPQELQDILNGRDAIIFDGVCVLCSGFFKFVVKRDPNAMFHFVTAQSPLGTQIYQALNLPTNNFETNLAITDGEIHMRLDAFNAVVRKIGGGWKILTLNRFLPRFLRDFMYHRIARNRYAIFGKTKTCLIPDMHLRTRFLPDGFTMEHA